MWWGPAGKDNYKGARERFQAPGPERNKFLLVPKKEGFDNPTPILELLVPQEVCPLECQLEILLIGMFPRLAKVSNDRGGHEWTSRFV